MRLGIRGAGDGLGQVHHFQIEGEGGVGGPGSLLNFQGHPVEHLTPTPKVTAPAPTLGKPCPLRMFAKPGLSS
ncbi:Uncharacterised protein [Mycolicibacterium flavescens]|uniref:hypothetical protein n=1 Tax=Mycobacterium neumannii TaxID=2048551 RepID=UPI000F71D5F3|nr:hypothetical protein [Mycobacterium neumannii]VEG42751.1 Uncharacterised protein [Mycolicibacterium flavescens]